MRLFSITIIGICVVVGGLFVVRSIHSQTAIITSGVEDAQYSLVVLADTVSLQHATDAQPKFVQGIVPVDEGDTVITSATGRARLVWPNETVTTIEEDSKIVIRKLSNGGSQSRIELIFGDIWSKVTRILGSGEYYEVETQDTVAAVRGTVFRTTYRNKNTRVQAVEHTVRVALRTADGATDDASGTDVVENTEVDISHTAATTTRKLVNKQITDTDRQERTFERIQRERGHNVKQFMEIPILTPTPTSTPKPTPTATSTPTTLPTSEAVGTPTPSVGALPSVRLESVFPKTVSVGATFSLEGANFITGRYTPRISRVLVGTMSAEFHIITGGTSIFVTAPQLIPGVYDVSVETTESDTISLPRVITIQ